MSFHLAAGRAYITGTDGGTRFDTDDALFHVIGSPVTGTVSIAAYSHPSSTNMDTTDTFTLGTCNSLCTDVIGSFYITGSTGYGVPTARWTTVMGGTLLWHIDGHDLVGANPDPNGNIGQMVLYNLRLTGGTVYLDRRRLFSKSGGTYTITAHDIQYKLKCGVWV